MCCHGTHNVAKKIPGLRRKPAAHAARGEIGATNSAFSHPPSNASRNTHTHTHTHRREPEERVEVAAAEGRHSERTHEALERRTRGGWTIRLLRHACPPPLLRRPPRIYPTPQLARERSVDVGYLPGGVDKYNE